MGGDATFTVVGSLEHWREIYVRVKPFASTDGFFDNFVLKYLDLVNPCLVHKYLLVPRSA